MKDEIKEKMTIGKAKKILRGFLAKDCYYDTPLYYAIPYLLDYITNLEKERNMFKGAFETMTENYFEENKKINKAIEELETLLPLCIMPNNTLIHATEKAKVIEKAINTLQGKSDE